MRHKLTRSLITSAHAPLLNSLKHIVLYTSRDTVLTLIFFSFVSTFQGIQKSLFSATKSRRLLYSLIIRNLHKHNSKKKILLVKTIGLKRKKNLSCCSYKTLKSAGSAILYVYTCMEEYLSLSVSALWIRQNICNGAQIQICLFDTARYLEWKSKTSLFQKAEAPYEVSSTQALLLWAKPLNHPSVDRCAQGERRVVYLHVFIYFLQPIHIKCNKASWKTCY